MRRLDSSAVGHTRILLFPGLLQWLALFAMASLSACATLHPTLPETMHPIPKSGPVAFENAHGQVSAQTSKQIIDTLEAASGDDAILKRHLAVEEALNQDSPLVLGNKLSLLQDGPATYAAMFAAIRGAKHSINLETYIFDDGRIGTEFADLLLAKQASGVQVNVIYDSVGCLDTPAEFFDRLREGGIRILEFNPINPANAHKRKWRLNNRDHRKLLVVDGRVAFLGGINISESYSSGSFSRSPKKKHGKSQAGWRDTQLQIEGPVVAELQKDFMDTWARQKGPPLPEKHYFPKLVTEGDEIVRAIASESDEPASPIYLTLLSAIDHAERFVHLTNAYFVPDPQLVRALTGAARRGVDVELILPGKSDSWLVFQAGRSHYTELLRAGIRIYERRDTVLHAKTASIDGVWATIGSTNLDWRSYLHNDEINAVILGTHFSRQMEAMFDRDRAASTLIEPARWQRRSPLQHMEEWVARRFEYWL